jgi:hypothetical protein
VGVGPRSVIWDPAKMGLYALARAMLLPGDAGRWECFGVPVRPSGCFRGTVVEGRGTPLLL